MRQVRNKNGDVSAYGFACGYVQNNKNATIYMEHGLMVVISLDEEGFYSEQRLDSIADARELFYKAQII